MYIWVYRSMKCIFDSWVRVVQGQLGNPLRVPLPYLRQEETQMDQHSSICTQHRTHTSPTWPQYDLKTMGSLRLLNQSSKEPPVLDQQEKNLDQYISTCTQ
jgi:hypothetical protein